MKAISLLQPWASLVVLGHKKIETRSRNTKYRGEVLIHASLGKSYGKGPGKQDCRSLHMDFQQEFSHLQLTKYEDLPFGAIIGKATIVSTIRTEIVNATNAKGVTHKTGKTWDFTHQEKSFGDYSPGRYGYLLCDPVLFAVPIPAKGQLGLWEFEMPESFHLPVANGHASFDMPPSVETMKAVEQMAELAYSKLKKS